MADRCSLLQSRSVFWEALEKCEAACPCPVTLILYWGAASCLHYPPKFKMLPVLFSHERQSSYLMLCLVSWPVPMQDLLPPAEVSKYWVKASLRASSWSPEHKEGPRSVSPEPSSPLDRDVFLEQYAFRDVQPQASSLSETRLPLLKPTRKPPHWPVFLPALAGSRLLARIVISVNWNDAGLAASTAASSLPSLLFEPDWLFWCWHDRLRRKCTVHTSLWKLPHVPQFSKILTLCGCHSLNSLLTKNPIVFLGEFQFAGVWKDSAFDMFLLKSSGHSHWGTRCWPCVWKIHYIFSRLICKRKIRFLKVMIQKKPLFFFNLHWSIIFVFHKMSALLLFGNFDEKELRVDNFSEVWFGT